ncbi:hypothetical protein E2C01_095650 [Portunus trituberculatus]|uniref:Uncharacterized protein n=1 Tax=Portunus trituberculatus TaxID=210409 RepID=A0A5B7JQD3_PORTR|nr:hypothetical protein [Portunus trituberculatus]
METRHGTEGVKKTDMDGWNVEIYGKPWRFGETEKRKRRRDNKRYADDTVLEADSEERLVDEI